MRTILFATAALVAAAPTSATAHPGHATAAAPSKVHELTHIRTTLHGSNGAVVVLIPGMSTPGAVWDETVAALSGTHRLLVVEVKGFDGKVAPQNAKAGLLDGIVEDIASDLDARKLNDVTLVGHSLGGLLAMKFGLAHPARASRLLIVDALPFFGTVFDGDATVESVRPRAVQMRDMMTAGAPTMRAAGEKAHANPPSGDCGKGMALDPVHACKVQIWSLSAEPTVTAQAVYEDILTDLRTDIAALQVPVTVLYQAAIDPKAAAARYETDYAALKSARLVPVDRTSHFIMLDRPDLFLAELEKMTTR